MPSAECDREDETRRGAGLVLERRCTEPEDEKKVHKTQAAVPRLEGPGVARRVKLEIADSRTVRSIDSRSFGRLRLAGRRRPEVTWG